MTHMGNLLAMPRPKLKLMITKIMTTITKKTFIKKTFRGVFLCEIQYNVFVIFYIK